mmetsp:Transcript_11349/g.21372  ORF Transcript_11349/g.21372 Transcript_11349/m.21372 type:complete len:198 (-) Transcript_11349:127-720(-)
MKAFTDKADFQIRFQPFQLYPDLKRGDAVGVDKYDFFKELYEMRGSDEESMKSRFKWLQGAWEKEGLTLADREKGHKWGNSFDAQRLISFARKQGLEDQMIEAIYTANHEQNQPLSNRAVLLECAAKAGVTGAEEMLSSEQESSEVKQKIQQYKQMGIDAVPVLVINNKYTIHGAPEAAELHGIISRIIEKDAEAAL